MKAKIKTATLVFVRDYAHLKQGDKGTYSRSLASDIVATGAAVYEKEPVAATIINEPKKAKKK